MYTTQWKTFNADAYKSLYNEWCNIAELLGNLSLFL